MELRTNHQNCSGCCTCRLACAIVNFQEVNLSKALLRIEGRFPAPGEYRIHLCDNCPEDAIQLQGGALQVEPNACTGCMICVEVCPHDVMFAHKDSDIPVKCNLCGECARTCPRNAILWVEDRESEMA